jgi:hypothetical protein
MAGTPVLREALGGSRPARGRTRGPQIRATPEMDDYTVVRWNGECGYTESAKYFLQLGVTAAPSRAN